MRAGLTAALGPGGQHDGVGGRPGSAAGAGGRRSRIAPRSATLINARVDVNAARADGATALLWAAHWNDLEIVDLLLAARANVNAADDHGVTALARASENASAAMVNKLLARAPTRTCAQTSGLTPLMIAARTGNVEVVQGAPGARAPTSTRRPPTRRRPR